MTEELQRTPPEESVERIVGWVRRFRGSPLGARLFTMAEREPSRVLREVPFLFKADLERKSGQAASKAAKAAKGEARSERVILRGQIDLLFQDDDGAWVVADYKASPLPSRPAARRRYERQVRLYAEALADVPGLGPARAMLIPLEGEPVNVSLGGVESAP
jgi:ATP-dependent helicase/nuclease subunit A